MQKQNELSLLTKCSGQDLSRLNTESVKRCYACAVYFQPFLMQGILWLPQEQSATSDEDKVYRETCMSTARVGT